MENKECKICSCQQAEDVDGYVDLYASTIEIVQGGWTSLRAGKDKDGKVIMYGMGDGDTELYYPKYCPECGRKLHD